MLFLKHIEIGGRAAHFGFEFSCMAGEVCLFQKTKKVLATVRECMKMYDQSNYQFILSWHALGSTG
jgi:hypothetical protein